MPIHSCNPYLIPPILNWLVTINDPLSVWMYEIGTEVGTDALGNIYVSGWTSYNDDWIAKFDPSGNLIWQRVVGTGSGLSNGLTVSPSGNCHFVIAVSGSGDFFGGQDAVIVKLNTDGVLQWSTGFGGTATDNPQGITVDSSDNVYITGYTNSEGPGGGANGDMFVAKFNSSGTIQWQRIIGGATTGEGGTVGGIAADGAGGIYAVGPGDDSRAHIVKYNSSGAIQWQRSLYNAFAGGDRPTGAAVDSSNNVFFIGNTTQSGTSSSAIYVVKYNSSGTIQWQRVLDASSSDWTWAMDTDSSGNVYLVGTDYGGYNVVVAKWNPSGVIQWQRSFGGTGGDVGYGIAIDPSGDMIFSGRVDYNDAFIMKVPSDGSKTGVYNANGYSVTYQPSSLTEVAGQMTDSVSSLTDQAGTLSTVSAGITDIAGAFDATLLPIP